MLYMLGSCYSYVRNKFWVRQMFSIDVFRRMSNLWVACVYNSLTCLQLTPAYEELMNHTLAYDDNFSACWNFHNILAVLRRIPTYTGVLLTNAQLTYNLFDVCQHFNKMYIRRACQMLAKMPRCDSTISDQLIKGYKISLCNLKAHCSNPCCNKSPIIIIVNVNTFTPFHKEKEKMKWENEKNIQKFRSGWASR